MNLIYILHILAGLFFIYMGLNSTKKHNILYKILVVLGIIIILYHSYRFYTKYNKNKNISYVNLFHLLFNAPLLLYIGLTNGKGVYPSNQLLFVLGIGITVLFSLRTLNINII